MTSELASIIHDLLKELSTEVDLHYEDQDFFALSPTIEPMRRAADALLEDGHEVPRAFEHILRRYLRARN